MTQACWSQNNVRLLCYIPELILRAWGLENARQEVAAAAALGWREGGGVRVRRRWRLGGAAAKAGSCWAQRGLQAAQARYPGPRLRPASADAPEPRRGRRPRARACELRILRLPAAAGPGASRGAGRERGFAGTPGRPLPPPLGFSLQAALPTRARGAPGQARLSRRPPHLKTRPFPRASRRFRPRCAPLFAPLLAFLSLSASHTLSFLVDGFLFCSHTGFPPAFQHHPFRMWFLTVK